MHRLALVVLIAFVPTLAAGQQFSPSDGRVSVGQKVYVVVDAPCTQQGCGGECVDGRIVALAPEMIAVESGGNRFELAAAEVRRVETYGDPVWNGLGYGFVFTFAATYAAGAIECRDGGMFCTQGFALAASGIWGGVGAGVGAIADAMIRGRKVIFARQTRASVGTIIRPEGGGVRVSVRF